MHLTYTEKASCGAIGNNTGVEFAPLLSREPHPFADEPFKNLCQPFPKKISSALDRGNYDKNKIFPGWGGTLKVKLANSGLRLGGWLRNRLEV